MATNASRIMGTFSAGWRSPELWLTPIIGLFGLAVFVFRHNSGIIVFDLRDRVEPFILFGVLPLFVTALAQGCMRALKWRLWAQVMAAGSIGCLTVGLCYFFAAPYFPATTPLDAEGRGNIVAVLQYKADVLGLIGALAAMLSTVLTRWLVRDRTSVQV